MGYKQVHVCDGCGYEVMITGGDDCGFLCFTATFECRTCKSLADYDVGVTPMGESMKITIEPLVCEDCNGKDLVPWDLELQGHCPKCGHKMHADESLGNIHWD